MPTKNLPRILKIKLHMLHFINNFYPKPIMKFKSIYTAILVPIYFLTQVVAPAFAFESISVVERGLLRPFEISAQAGLITERNIAPNARGTLIHIQDAHAVYDAQKKIQQVISELHSQLKIKTIFLEGGSGRLDPELRHLFPKGKKLTEAEREAWMRVIDAEFARFCADVDAGLDTLLDPYGATGVDEFFAVATESFFVTPKEMRARHPDLYGLLARYFMQNTAAFNAA